MVTADTLTKKDRSPVTVADFGSQAVVCRVLQQAFPADPVVGEENAGVLREAGNEELRQRVEHEVTEQAPGSTPDDVLSWIDRGASAGGKARFWVLDPIDGTKGFLRGEQYAVALALVEGGQVQVGILACPNLPSQWGGEGAGSLFVAVRGQGTEMLALEPAASAAGVKASNREDCSQARIVESVEAAHGNHGVHDQIKEQLNISVPSVRLDSQAKYGVLARGEADLYLRMPTSDTYREKIWDQAAGAIIIEEAGGTVTDMHGRPLDFTTGRRLENNQGIVASNGLLHERVVQVIGQLQSA
jgi:3'(2'), 5'-bisphosphate nucleotidase